MLSEARYHAKHLGCILGKAGVKKVVFDGMMSRCSLLCGIKGMQTGAPSRGTNDEQTFRKTTPIHPKLDLMPNQLQHVLFAIPKRQFSLARKMVEFAPKKVQPYMRLMRMDRPIGTQKSLRPNEACNIYFILILSLCID